MPKTNLWKSPQVVPVLAYGDVPNAVEWLTRVFGFCERAEARLTGEGWVMTWMEIGDGLIRLGTAGRHDLQSPRNINGVSQSMRVYVDDVDQYFERARGGGATIISELEERFSGGRIYRAEPRTRPSVSVRRHSWIVTACMIAIALAGCNRPDEARSLSFDVAGRFPHDPTAYTQGLVWDDTVLYESTGLYGHSEIRQVDLKTGNVRLSVPLPGERFGEGLALLDGKLYQLTWQSGIAYVYDKQTLALLDSVSYAGEGWGLATDGRLLIMSDGSDSLRVVDPATFKTERVVHVRYQGSPMYKLNELEYVNGNVLANVYESDWVVRIDPATGEVLELMDFADLYPDRPATAEVMNGIAVAPNGRGLLLTGKHWPTVFQVHLKDTAKP